MKVFTYGEILDRVQAETDTEDEDFIDFDEFVGYGNAAIDDIEADALKIHEEYFLDEADIALVIGTAKYDLPSEIYGQKIRSVVYHNGAEIYKIRRIPRGHKYLSVEFTKEFGSADDYRYYLLHDSAATGYQFVLTPTSRETSSSNVVMRFIRNANRIPLSSETGETETTVRATKIDIPEGQNFITEFMKERVIGKEERGSTSHQAAMLRVAAVRKRYIDTLTERVLDDDTLIQGDFSHYNEHS